MNKTIKGACLVAATAMLPLSQAATAGEVNISGWVNEAMTYYDDGQGSDVVQSSDNGATLNSRITFTGSADAGSTGMKAGFEITMEPTNGFNSGALGGVTPLLTATQANFSDDNGFAESVSLLASNLWLSGGFGKVTLGTQSMPTDNIAVLDDPSATLWTNVAPVFRLTGFTMRGLGAGAGAGNWGSFLQCLNTAALAIGIDCNGIYRNGIRYDLPTFAGIDIAVGYSNDDIYDIAAKYKTSLAGLNASLSLGYSINQGGSGTSSVANGILNGGAVGANIGSGSFAGTNETEMFAMQVGLMDPATGIFGAISYQREDAETTLATLSDDNNSWYFKGGIKRDFNSLGATSIHGSYGSYNDQFGTAGTTTGAGVDGSEVERLSFGVTQYIGSQLQIYGTWEQLDLDVDCAGTAAVVTACNAQYAGVEELDMFSLGAVFFF